MRTKYSVFLIALTTAGALLACEGFFETTRSEGTRIVAPPDLAAPPTTPEPTAMVSTNTCKLGRTYQGFGEELTRTRTQGELGTERRRPKHYQALVVDYERAFAGRPILLGEAEATFGAIPERWYTEPPTSAVAIVMAFRIAFQGCLANSTQLDLPRFPPTLETARERCSAWTTLFLGRKALPSETEKCATLIQDTAQSETDSRRRWAYGCAFILTTPDFLTF
jgi:hypothetical protein